MKKISSTSFLLISIVCAAYAQTQSNLKGNSSPAIPRPKLIIGLVIDQMRWDYLYKFSNRYSPHGFKRLLSEGHSFENTFIPFTPTYTAPGHASIYTGSVPAIHGMVGNNWYDKINHKNIYCTADTSVSAVGSNTIAGKMSPRNLWATTITDELRLSNNFKSKVIGIALKDRGAILVAGHSGNAAYWYDDANGKFISSSYYMKELPQWVSSFNKKDLPSVYMGKDWNTLYPIEKYTVSTADNNPYESPVSGEISPVFPHKMSTITMGKFAAFKFTPFANTFSFDFAKAAIENEKLGSGTVTDFLALSISSTDYIGHNFGPNSIEIEDTYYRLDKDMEDFLRYLDTKIGKGNYLIFLTADHGVAHIPSFLNEHQIPAGYFDDTEIRNDINKKIKEEFGLNNVIENVQNYQLYLNTAEMEKSTQNADVIKSAVIKLLRTKAYVVNAFETEKLQQTTLPEPQKNRIANGYTPTRSGDIMYTVKPGYFDGGSKGTTHGLWNPYDAHIPNVWFGWNIKPGKTNRETYMTDIAPTLAALLKIQMPNGCVGMVLTEAMK